jgi:superfamily II DNA or RNA helicase
MASPFQILRKHIPITTNYDREKYNKTMKYRWDPYDDCPIENIGKLCYILRRICFEDPSRMMKLRELLHTMNKVIIFYNYTPELVILRRICAEEGFDIGEWNGEKHTEIPHADKWVYLCQYNSASEGWNCIETNNIIFYSLSYSYKMTEQARGRIDRLNTPFNQLNYFYLMSKAPIDMAIKRALDEKRNFNEKKFIGG